MVVRATRPIQQNKNKEVNNAGYGGVHGGNI